MSHRKGVMGGGWTGGGRGRLGKLKGGGGESGSEGRT